MLFAAGRGMDSVLQDRSTRCALGRSPAFSFAAVLAIALGWAEAARCSAC
jgi:hypothetical protein